MPASERTPGAPATSTDSPASTAWEWRGAGSSANPPLQRGIARHERHVIIEVVIGRCLLPSRDRPAAALIRLARHEAIDIGCADFILRLAVVFANHQLAGDS